MKGVWHIFITYKMNHNAFENVPKTLYVTHSWYWVTICVSRVVCSMELRQLIYHIGGRLIHCQCMVLKFRHSNAWTIERSLYVPLLSRSKNITKFAHCTKDNLMGAYQSFSFRLYYQCLPKSTPKKPHSYFMS